VSITHRTTQTDFASLISPSLCFGCLFGWCFLCCWLLFCCSS
jgi:hypothetical protein